MKCKFLPILFLLLMYITNTYSQQYGRMFIIEPNYSGDFFVDRIAQQIYFGWTLKVDLKTGIVDTIEHPLISTITFGNKQHLMFNRDTLYDIDKGSYLPLFPKDTIYNSYWHFYPYFSPNDSNLMFTAFYPPPPNSGREIINNFIFSLKDSSFIQVDSAVWPYSDYSGYGNAPQWSSDTSFVYAAGDSAIAEYFIRSRRIDTLVSLHSQKYHNKIVSFAYNTKYNILAYSTDIGYSVPDISPLIYFHYKDSTSDYLAFSPVRDDPNCGESLNSIYTFLSWSPNNDKLGFISSDPINDIAIVNFYSLNSKHSYKLTRCNNIDNIYDLQWANEDTLVYPNSFYGSLYGIDVSNVDIIKENNEKQRPSDFSLNCYPNPFNPSTTIRYDIPKLSHVTISIYDILGRKVKTIVNAEMLPGHYKIKFNASDLASGVYFYQLNAGNYIATKKMLLLK